MTATRGAVARLGLALLLGGCATQREQRLSSAEARARPTDDACEPHGKAKTPDEVWFCGYWHWDGVRYEWVPGGFARPPR